MISMKGVKNNASGHAKNKQRDQETLVPLLNNASSNDSLMPLSAGGGLSGSSENNMVFLLMNCVLL